ncbi:MAG: tRNA (adenosine(37)-N6)-dimethylallyltransferase MiaA [Bacilli bacterium]|nr:tRNA (adenosine(37)-N6)-dimethylallyltransferase MiaA [Bacilli bacterium]
MMSKIIVITGPTGVGKTKLSIALAKKLNGEIINADSMQIYKDLNIGTAKVTEAEKENIPHHLFDIKKVTEDYSVYDYQIDGRKVIDKLLKENKTPIIVGGTGLYIKALLYNYKFNKEVNNNEYDNLSDEELYNKLKLIKPDTDIHPNNRRRIIRALSIKEDNNEGNELLYDAIFIGLTTNRSNLYNIINNRVDKMIEEGLLLEVEALYKKGIRSKAVMTGIGYKELYPYFDKEISLEASVDLIKKNSRHYAKRQYTWFNNQMNVKWFDVHYDEFLKTIDEVLEYIKRITN